MATIIGKDTFQDLKFETLKEGDIVRSKIGGMSYIITQVDTYNATAIRQINISNECEWIVLKRN